MIQVKATQTLVDARSAERMSNATSAAHQQRDPDTGKWVHTLRQSGIGEFMICPERFRRGLASDFVSLDTDASAVGTAVHLTIEDAIDLMMSDDVVLGADDMEGLFDHNWSMLQTHVKNPEGEWVTRSVANPMEWVKRTPEAAALFGQRCVRRFADHTLPTLEPIATEIPFGPLPLYEDHQRLIQVKGSIDYFDAKLGVIDWKSAGRKYAPWEKERWAIQPTVYMYAVRHMISGLWGGDDQVRSLPHLAGWQHQHSLLDMADDEFTFIVYDDNGLKGGPPQHVTVQRGREWDDWLRTQALSMVKLLETDLDQYPMNDQHALCSASWCDHWATCKGTTVDIGK